MSTAASIRRENLRGLVADHGGVLLFSTAVGCESGSISRITSANHSRNCGDRFARKIETALGLEPGWLDRPHYAPPGGRSADSNVSPFAGTFVRLPIISSAESKNWRDVLAMDIKKTKSTTVVGRGYSSGSFAYQMDGDVMISASGRGIPDGALAIVDPEIPPLSGRIVIAEHDSTGQLLCRRLMVEGGESLLVPLNNRYPVRSLDGHKIVGVVVQVQMDMLDID